MAGTLALALTAIGCASPAQPRPPSLYIPVPVTDLSAERSGSSVELRLTIPDRSTDKLTLRQPTLRGALCRSLDSSPCEPIVSFIADTRSATPPARNTFTYRDILPAELATGTPHLLTYRVEFFSPRGLSAGRSDPAFAASGTAPPLVQGLHANGTRPGVLLTWVPAPLQSGEVILQREDLAAEAIQPPAAASSARSRKAGSAKLWLASNSASDSTLDTTLKPDTPYRYRAVRLRVVQLGGHSLQLRSELSTPADLTLQQIYPPQRPTGLNLAAFDDGKAFAVDLIWQPVDATSTVNGPAPPLVGYNVYRAMPGSKPERQNAAPLPLPAFHDATAAPATRYTYTVTAIDARGNESAPAEATLEP